MTILKTDQCVASSNPLLEDFRLAAKAMQSAMPALDRLDRAFEQVSRIDNPQLWLRRRETLIIYRHDVWNPTYMWYRESFANAYQASPDATMSIDRAHLQ